MPAKSYQRKQFYEDQTSPDRSLRGSASEDMVQLSPDWAVDMQGMMGNSAVCGIISLAGGGDDREH